MAASIRFGVIGAGLMGREFASAAARWLHLVPDIPCPEIVAVADPSAAARDWFTQRVPTVAQSTADAQALLSNPDVDAVYIAVPHHLHRDIYIAAIESGKHLFAEKPFGIDLPACQEILQASDRHPEVLVRVSSEFPFYPAVQQIIRHFHNGDFGSVFEIRAAFAHSSDLDPQKPINWKRQIATNGAYGCMGDLGLHVCHVPFRLGFTPRNVRALLSKIIAERPDGHGGMAPCETWDNATLAIESESGIPMLLETKRISPGDTNSWSLEIFGTEMSARFTTKRPKSLEILRFAPSQPQGWQTIDLGSQSAYHVVTGAIFEFGFSDSILQMWASFCHELAGGDPPFRCATPSEALLSHQLFTAALRSQSHASVEPIP